VRVLANESFPADAVEALRTSGHDVTWVRTDCPGISDQEVLRRATAEGRVLVTFDEDFGELAYRVRTPAPFGIILFRLPLTSPSELASMAIAAVESLGDCAGWFAVVERDRVRATPLPSGP